MNYEEDLELRSEEVQEILGTPPKWILRWGTLLTLFILLLMVWLSWYFKYPEKVEAPIIITSSIPPMDVIAPETGYLDQLLKENNDTVRRGDLLGIIQSTTDYEDVIELEEYLDNFALLNENTALIENKAPKRNLVLGEGLQRNYSDFIQAYEEYMLRIEGSSGRSDESRYRSQIRKIQQSIAIEEQRRAETVKRIRSLNTILEDKQDKYARKLMPSSEIEKTSEQLEDVRRKLDAYDVSINEKELEIERIKTRMSTSIQQLRESNLSSYIALNESVKQLQSLIDAWKQSYILSAPSEGTVTYYGSKTTSGRYVQAGEIVMAILPMDTMLRSGQNEIIGKVSLPIEGSGKVTENQLVKIKFDSYPAHEFGLVEGIVVQKSRLPRNRTYIIEVRFPNGLLTSFGKQISFDQQMTGTATIITQDKRFAERIFEKLIQIFEV